MLEHGEENPERKARWGPSSAVDLNGIRIQFKAVVTASDDDDDDQGIKKAISLSVTAAHEPHRLGKFHSIALHSSERLCPTAPSSSTNVGLRAWELSARMLYYRNRFFSNQLARAALAITIFYRNHRLAT